MIGAGQIEAYRRRGYLVVEGVLNPTEVAELRRVTEAIIDRARSMTRSDTVLDLDRDHSPQHPRVRRIKDAPAQHPRYAELIRDERIVGIMSKLIGPDIRLRGGKLNIKAAGHGAAVEWHQDWAFYPHTNDDILAVGVLLDDAGPDNAPLLVLPGSHRGPIWDHHARGVFCGAIDRTTTGLDVSGAVPLTAPAGSVTFHHVRMVHGSDLNRSDRDRRMLFYECAAADAWPLLGVDDYKAFLEGVIAGRHILEPRMVPAPIRIPLPEPFDNLHVDGTIYEAQQLLVHRSFATADARAG